MKRQCLSPGNEQQSGPQRKYNPSKVPASIRDNSPSRQWTAQPNTGTLLSSSSVPQAHRRGRRTSRRPRTDRCRRGVYAAAPDDGPEGHVRRAPADRVHHRRQIRQRHGDALCHDADHRPSRAELSATTSTTMSSSPIPRPERGGPSPKQPVRCPRLATCELERQSLVQSPIWAGTLHSVVSLFDRAGRTFEEIKQSIVSGRGSDYVCRSCAKSLAEDFEHCPHCGEAAVERVE